MFRRAAEGRVAVPLPVLRVQGQKGQQVDGGLKYIEAVAGPGPVETAPGITALYVAPVALALGVEAPLVGVTGSAVFIESNEHSVVVLLCLVFGWLPALIDQPLLRESIENLPADMPLLEQIGIHPPHGLIGGWRGKFLRLVPFLFLS